VERGLRSAGRGVCLAALALSVVVARVHGLARSDEATVNVAVADARGLPVAGLEAPDFAVRAGGVDSHVLGVRPSADPISFVLVIATDSRDVLPVREALAIVTEMLGRQQVGNRIAVMRPEDLGVSFEPAAGSLNAVLRDFNRSFATGVELLPGITAAARALGQQPPGRRSVFAIARVGWVDVVEHGPGGKQVVEALERNTSSLWGVTVAPGSTDGRTVGEQVMTSATKLSGGRAETILDTTALAATIRRLLMLMVSQYAVTYERPNSQGRESLRIGVRRDGVVVIAPTWVE
jgi:hypothetical protein